MELRQLRYLDAVARHRSFTQAARELHVAQSVLSQQVSRLEGELGVQLLRRTTRRVDVTEAGEMVLARARRAIAEADGVRDDLDALRGLVRGTLRLGSSTSGCVRSAALIAGFNRAHPGVAVILREDAPPALFAQLRDGTLDLVTTIVDVDVDGLDGFESTRLLDEELVVIAALDHSFARAKQVRVDRLAREPLITSGPGSALRETLLALVPSGRVVAEADDLETVCELAASGLGVTVLPRAFVAARSDRLAIRSLNPRYSRPVSLVWRARERPTPAAQAFREHVLSSMRA